MRWGNHKIPWLVVGLALTFGMVPLAAQYETGEAERIEMNLDQLEQKADEVVKVTLFGKSLEQGKKLLALRKNVTSPVRSFLSSLKGVYRRTYRFGKTKPEQEDIEPIYQQLADGGWVPLIETENREEDVSVSVYSYYENDEVAGVTVVSSGPDEVTVVKIMGPIDLEILSDIGKGFGLPVMNLASTELTKKNVELPKPAK